MCKDEDAGCYQTTWHYCSLTQTCFNWEHMGETPQKNRTLEITVSVIQNTVSKAAGKHLGHIEHFLRFAHNHTHLWLPMGCARVTTRCPSRKSL